jgi:hypothetical protein
MKITKERLKTIIKEELETVLNELPVIPRGGGKAMNCAQALARKEELQGEMGFEQGSDSMSSPNRSLGPSQRYVEIQDQLNKLNSDYSHCPSFRDAAQREE